MEHNIPGYLDGTLSKSEMEAFQKRLLSDTEFRKEVEAFEMLFKDIEQEEPVEEVEFSDDPPSEESSSEEEESGSDEE